MLDDIDIKILNILQANGRMSITEIAKKVFLSTSPCSDRIKKLQRDNVIIGYSAIINPHKVKRPLLAYLEITLSSKSETVFEAVNKEFADDPRVLGCHLVSGEFDYLVKARFSDMNEFHTFLGEVLSRIPVSAKSNSHFVIESIKDSFTLNI